MRFSNMHTHSTFSDGKNTPKEIVEAAINMNFSAIGFSDHSDTCTVDPLYCMRKEQYADYRRTLADLAYRYEEKIEVLTGMELDYYSDDPGEGFDYRIGSVHYLYDGVNCYPIDHSLAQQQDCIARLCNGNRIDMAKRYYDLVVTHIEKCRPTFVGHFDVITKFSLFDDDNPDYRRVALEALDEVMKVCPVIELNTGAIGRGVRTVPYPADFLLKRVLENKGEIILSSDSHAAATLACHFAESAQDLKAMGFDHVLSLHKDGFHKEML